MKSTFAKLIFCVFAINNFKIYASNDITGFWNSNNGDKKVQIIIEACPGNVNTRCGKISRLELSAGHSQAYVDRHNPDDTLKTRPLIGLEILQNMTADPETQDCWQGGDLYNPEDGRTYSCKIQLIHDDKGAPVLKARIFIGIELIGETHYWTR